MICYNWWQVICIMTWWLDVHRTPGMLVCRTVEPGASGQRNTHFSFTCTLHKNITTQSHEQTVWWNGGIVLCLRIKIRITRRLAFEIRVLAGLGLGTAPTKLRLRQQLRQQRVHNCASSSSRFSPSSSLSFYIIICYFTYERSSKECVVIEISST